MRDQDKTQEQLICELEELRRQMALLAGEAVERRRPEEELRRSQTLLTEAEKLSHTGAWQWDLRANQWTFSDEWLSIHGCHRRTLPLEELLPIAHPGDREAIAQAFEDVRNGIKPYEMEHRIIRQDTGEVRVVKARGRYVLDSTGKVARVYGFALDITEQKQAETALRESERRFRAMFDQAPLGIALLDSHTGHFVRINSRYCEIAGRTEEEMLSLDYQSITHPEDLQVCLDHVAHLVEGKVRSCGWEKRYVWPDGSIVWVNLTIVALWDEDERPRFHLTMVEDITERKRAEEALKKAHEELEEKVSLRTAELEIVNQRLQEKIKEQQRAEEALRASEERFRVTFEEAPVGIVIGSGDGMIARANRAVCRMGGYTPEELVGRHVRDLTHPNDRNLSVPFVEKLLSGEIPSFTLEKRYLRKDGQPFWAQATTAAIRGSDGKVAFALGIVEDITERKQAEEALHRERRTLEHMLQASDHERQLIAYDIHDGLAQELAGAIMQFQVYNQFKDTNADEAKKAYDGGVTLLRKGHAEARRLISGVRPPILDESGVMAAIAHLIHDPAFDHGPQIQLRSNVRFKRLASVVENVIYRIVQEGLSNARTHSESKKIEVSLVQRDDRLRIEIRDWGVGFDPKTVAEQRFGLEGIRERARLLGGKCRIQSKPCEGTSILVELPVVEQEPE
jgi:PAS domain S-box-containing protein